MSLTDIGGKTRCPSCSDKDEGGFIMNSRREFLKIGMSLGIGVLLREDLARAGEERSRPQVRRLWTERQIQGFLARLREQDQLHGLEATVKQIANLRYVVETIQPDRHEEMAFAVWAYLHTYSVAIFTDEYRRRRDQETSNWPGHPLFALRPWGRPDTYGMIVYREQMQALFGELTGRKAFTDGEYRQLSISRSHKPFYEEEFNALLDEAYRKSLTPGEQKRIFEAIDLYWPHVQLYVYCSTLAGQAWQSAQN